MFTPIDRRTFLRASGVALALPLLETMHPALARAAAAAPRRMLNICNTLGLYPQSWSPTTAGPDYETTEYLALLDKHRERYSLFSGLSHEEQTGRQAHNSEITWLTSARHPGLDGFQNTISLDQAAANHLGYVTRFPSLVLGTATPQSQSYTRGGVMVPAETSPAGLFTNMFLQGDAEEVERQRRSLNDGGQHSRSAESTAGVAGSAREHGGPAEAGRLLRRAAHRRAGTQRGAGVGGQAQAGRRRGSVHRHSGSRRPHRPASQSCSA